MKWGRRGRVTQTYKDKSAAALSCVHVFIKVKATSRKRVEWPASPAGWETNASRLAVVMAAWSCPSVCAAHREEVGDVKVKNKEKKKSPLQTIESKKQKMMKGQQASELFFLHHSIFPYIEN